MYEFDLFIVNLNFFLFCIECICTIIIYIFITNIINISSVIMSDFVSFIIVLFAQAVDPGLSTYLISHKKEVRKAENVTLCRFLLKHIIVNWILGI